MVICGRKVARTRSLIVKTIRNAKRPDLADFRSYDGDVHRITNKAEEFCRRLP